MLIAGRDLTEPQRRQVLAAFVHRWTNENAAQTYGRRCPACVQRYQCEPEAATEVNGVPWHDYHAPLTSDSNWLLAHAFHFTKAGDMDPRIHQCEPQYMAGETA